MNRLETSEALRMHGRWRYGSTLAVTVLLALSPLRTWAQDAPLRDMVDAHIRESWHAQGMTANAAASDSEFLRRVWLGSRSRRWDPDRWT